MLIITGARKGWNGVGRGFSDAIPAWRKTSATETRCGTCPLAAADFRPPQVYLDPADHPGPPPKSVRPYRSPAMPLRARLWSRPCIPMGAGTPRTGPASRPCEVRSASPRSTMPFLATTLAGGGCSLSRAPSGCRPARWRPRQGGGGSGASAGTRASDPHHSRSTMPFPATTLAGGGRSRSPAVRIMMWANAGRLAGEVASSIRLGGPITHEVDCGPGYHRDGRGPACTRCTRPGKGCLNFRIPSRAALAPTIPISGRLRLPVDELHAWSAGRSLPSVSGPRPA